MFMFPEPTSKEYRLRYVTLNKLSSELFSTDAFPRPTQSNLGFYSYPLKNESLKYEINRVNDKILDRWNLKQKAWWIGKPGEDAQMMFDLHRKHKDTREVDPRYKIQNCIFPRSYQYELDCIETRRQQKLQEKIWREEQEELKAKEQGDEAKLKEDPCVCFDLITEKTKVADIAHDEKVDALRWQHPPSVFGKSQQDPCKRREQFQTFGQSYKTEACRFYYENFPPPPLSKYLESFSK